MSHYVINSIRSSIFSALQVIGNTKCITEIFDMIADINGSYSYGIFITFAVQ